MFKKHLKDEIFPQVLPSVFLKMTIYWLSAVPFQNEASGTGSLQRLIGALWSELNPWAKEHGDVLVTSEHSHGLSV